MFNLDDNENILSREHLPQRFLLQLESPAPDQSVSESRHQEKKPLPKSIQSIDAVRDKAESAAIHQALKSAKYNKSKAAQMLGISRNKLYRKLKQLGLVDYHGHYLEEDNI